MLSVKYGPFHEIEEAFIAKLRELNFQHPLGPVAVVTPSRRMADRLQRLAAVEQGLALLNVHFHTFYSLALGVVEESGFPGKKLVSDPVFQDRLVDRLLEENRAIALVFGGPSRPRGLAGTLRSSLRDLTDAGVSGPDLEENFGSELLRESRERERLSALLRLAEAYDNRLEDLGLLTPSGLTRLAAERSGDSAFLSGFKEILYYGFYDLTGLQLEFFETVVSRHPSILFFPYRRGHPAFRFADALFEEKLLKYGAEKAPPHGKPPALAPALDRLFESSAGGAKALKGRLALINASGARDEAWAAAKEILSHVEGGECRYEEIGVVARSLEPYRAAIAEVFRENAIPFDLRSSQPLLSAPLAKCALNLLSLRLRDFPAATVEDIFSSPYFKRGAQMSPRRLFHWRLIIRRLGIRAGWLQWRGKLEGRVSENLPLYPGKAREGPPGTLIPKEDLRSLWEQLSSWNKALSAESKSWSQYSRLARELIELELGLPDKPAQAETAAFSAVLSEIDSLSLFDLMGGSPSEDEFLDCLEEKLKRAALETGAGSRGVRVMDAMDARGESFKVLFLMGLKEKLFPRPVAEDPLLRDTVRSALRHPAGYWIARKASGIEEERLLFYLMAASARERLICVYPRSDENGRAEVPSLYMRELCRAAGLSMADEETNRRLPRQPVSKLRSCPAELLSPKEASLRLTLEGGGPADSLSLAGRDGGLLGSCLKVLPPFISWGKAGERDGLMGPPEEYLSELLQGGLSPSALDSFAQCPFQFFADRVLGLGRREEAAPKGEFAAWTRGRIYHLVMERFHSGLGEDFWKRPAAPWERELEAAIDSVFEEFSWREMGVYPVLWLSARQSMSACLRRFAAEDVSEIRASGFAPAWLERGLKAPVPGRLPARLKGLELHGIIDRVDLDPSGKRFRVIDYKTRLRGKSKLSSQIAGGRQNQLPIYAELSAAALEGRGTLESARLASFEDSPETTGLDRAQSYEGPEWARDREGFFERVSGMVEEIARGRFPIRPDEGPYGYCGWCEFSAICRKSHGPSRRRAAAALS